MKGLYLSICIRLLSPPDQARGERVSGLSRFACLFLAGCPQATRVSFIVENVCVTFSFCSSNSVHHKIGISETRLLILSTHPPLPPPPSVLSSPYISHPFRSLDLHEENSQLHHFVSRSRPVISHHRPLRTGKYHPEATTLRCQTRKQYPPSRTVSRIQQYKEKELGKPQKTKDETRPAKWLAQKTATARPVQTYTWPGL